MEPGLQLKLLMLFLWLASVLILARKFLRGKASLHWSKVIGQVRSSCIEAKSAGNGIMFYSPNIEYEYTIDNRTYTSNNFTYLGTSGLTRKYAEKYTNKYIVGCDIVIFYNPRKPDMSVIVPGVHWGQYVGMFFSTLMLFGIAHIVEILNIILKKSVAHGF